jgi:hypothetical protein
LFPFEVSEGTCEKFHSSIRIRKSFSIEEEEEVIVSQASLGEREAIGI